MKVKQTEFSRRYHAALHGFLKREPGSSMEPARELGGCAMTLGLETLDLAKIHEMALVSLMLPNDPSYTRDGLMACAGLFFAEAITPIEQTHRGAREAKIHLSQIVKALSQRTLELAKSVEELKQEIIQRKAVEESLRVSQQTSSSLLEKSREMQEELRHLSRQLLSVQEEERKRISRELHDVIAQTLMGINVRLAGLKAESTVSTKELQKKIATTQRLVERSVDIIHRFARELRPSVLDDLGLIPALRTLMKDFTEDTGVRVSLTAFAEIELLDNAKRTVFYRVAQEALNNVARHAQASRAEVTIRNEKGVICMEIKDNGKGFEPDAKPGAKKNNRLGLLGMRERVEMIGGTFYVDSAPDKPTTVRVEIPPDINSSKNGSKNHSDQATTLECP